MMGLALLSAGLVAGMNAAAVDEYINRCAIPIVSGAPVVTDGLHEVDAAGFGARPGPEASNARFITDEGANIRIASSRVDLVGAACMLLPVAATEETNNEILIHDAVARIEASLADAGYTAHRLAPEKSARQQVETIHALHGGAMATFLIAADEAGRITQLIAMERTPETLSKNGGDE